MNKSRKLDNPATTEADTACQTARREGRRAYVHFPRWVLILLLVLMVSGCGTAVPVINADFPDPIVQQVPYRVGVYYPPEFSGYVYQDDDEKVTFELGSTQVKVFNQIFDALFANSTQINIPPQGREHPDFDLVLVPVLEQYAFLSPSDTATNFYTVSLEYFINMYRADGSPIGRFPLIAYGKNRTGMMARAEPLGDATVTALRDVAAALVTQFRKALLEEPWEQNRSQPEEEDGGQESADE